MLSPIRELRLLSRRLLRNRGFSVLSVGTLAVGIGATVAIFSVVYGVLFKPLPFPEADRLVGLWHRAPGIDLPQIEQSLDTYVLYRDRAQSFEAIGLERRSQASLTGTGDPVQIRTALATSSLFDVLAVPPLIGRTISPEDDAVDAPLVVVLSHGTWMTRFGGDRDVLGRTIELNGTAREVVGVMPAGFRDLYGTSELWMPLQVDESLLPQVSFSYQGIARLKDGVTLEAAEAELTPLFQQLPDVFPGGMTSQMIEDAQITAMVNPLQDDIVGDIGDVLWVLLATVGLVFLIAGANVANLFLVRAEASQREIAVRSALGAGQGRITAQFFTDSLSLSLIGGAIGVVLAWGGIRVLTAMGPGQLPRLDEVGLAPPVILFAAAASLLAGLSFGLLTAYRYSNPQLALALKQGGRGGDASKHTHRTRNAIVVGQVALALVLLVGSGLLLRSFEQLRSVDPGFDPEGVLAVRIALPSASYPSGGEVGRFYEDLMLELGSLPGVTSVGAINNIPLGEGQSNDALVVEDFPPIPGGLPEVIRSVHADPGYFATMGIPVYEGRVFETLDNRTTNPVAVISTSLADRFWPEGGAVGRRVSPSLEQDDESQWFTIVGVVGDVHDSGLHLPADEMVYYPTSVPNPEGEPFVDRARTMVLKTPRDPLALVETVRETIHRHDARLPLISLTSMRDLMWETLARTTFTMTLLGVAAAVALILGMVGLYGVISYVIAQRTREIGLRMAVGADRGDISRMVLRQGVRMALIGVALGLVGAAFLTRAMSALLFQVSATDLTTFFVAPVLLLVVSASASYIPALKASRVDPMEALRHE